MDRTRASRLVCPVIHTHARPPVVQEGTVAGKGSGIVWGDLRCSSIRSGPAQTEWSCWLGAVPVEAPWHPSLSQGQTGQWILTLTFGLSNLPPDSLEKITGNLPQPGRRIPFFCDFSHLLASDPSGLSRLRSPAAIQCLQWQQLLLGPGHLRLLPLPLLPCFSVSSVLRTPPNRSPSATGLPLPDQLDPSPILPPAFDFCLPAD